MKGLLVVNEFLMTEKFRELYDMLFLAASQQAICLEQKTNAQLLPVLGERAETIEASFVLFWDKDIRLAKALENRRLLVANSARAIEVCDDKALTHLLLEKAGVPMPRTILAPMTYSNIGYTNLQFLELAAEKLRFPMVVKECFGSFGWQVYLVNNQEELSKLVKELAGKPFLMQEFIKSSFGKDIRLQVVGDKVVAAMYRYSETGDFRANISNGGKMKAYEPTEEEKRLAVRACQALGLDFAGVDILFGEAGPVVCEVNSNAHFKNIYNCTGVNVAEHILGYLKEKASVSGL
ncbi:MAG: ATP-grasp domain-containing protein [Acetivibrio ethanolgignens]